MPQNCVSALRRNFPMGNRLRSKETHFAKPATIDYHVASEKIPGGSMGIFMSPGDSTERGLSSLHDLFLCMSVPSLVAVRGELS
jgi:hypothetical protein